MPKLDLRSKLKNMSGKNTPGCQEVLHVKLNDVPTSNGKIKGNQQTNTETDRPTMRFMYNAFHCPYLRKHTTGICGMYYTVTTSSLFDFNI